MDEILGYNYSNETDTFSRATVYYALKGGANLNVHGRKISGTIQIRIIAQFIYVLSPNVQYALEGVSHF